MIHIVPQVILFASLTGDPWATLSYRAKAAAPIGSTQILGNFAQYVKASKKEMAFILNECVLSR
jgi:hypothetical protein